MIFGVLIEILRQKMKRSFLKRKKMYFSVNTRGILAYRYNDRTYDMSYSSALRQIAFVLNISSIWLMKNASNAVQQG